MCDILNFGVFFFSFLFFSFLFFIILRLLLPIEIFVLNVLIFILFYFYFLGPQEGFTGLLDQELLNVIPKGSDLIADYTRPSRWSDAYDHVRRKYDDFDDYR